MLTAYVDSSIPSVTTQSPWPIVLQALSPHPTHNSPFPLAAQDHCGNPQTATTWSIAQAQEGTPGVASNSATLAGDMRRVQVLGGDPADMLPTEQDFERSLTTMQDNKPKVAFYAEDVTVKNAACLEDQEKRVLRGPVQVTTAVTIPTPAASAIVSWSTTRTTPISTITTYAIIAHEELLDAIRAMEKRNAKLPATRDLQSICEGGEAIVERPPWCGTASALTQF